MSTTAAEALHELGPAWLVPLGDSPVEWAHWFGRNAPLVLEIGSGMGHSTLAQAAADPDTDVLAVDVHTPGIGTLLAGAARAELRNVRAIVGDAVEVVDLMLRPDELAGVRIYFPDPWPKVRHHKRRLIQPEFVDLLASRVQPGGFIHCATDDLGYGRQMVGVFSKHPDLDNAFVGFAPRPSDRPPTKFEQRATGAGRQVVDVYVTRTLSA
ncbi:MAG TPA: tRNA (guanosine(46)-N7)-methyltransferase TrmB [Actinomycetes bacterium]|nr:tRNA (guanosine(46)-N7)-methyltransferase TrmB [Actinomycetes bacterium]